MLFGVYKGMRIKTNKVFSKLAIFTLLILFLLTSAFAVLDDALASYSFDNSSNVCKDDSGNGYDCTLYNSPTHVTSGTLLIGSGAVDFDGTNDFLSAPVDFQVDIGIGNPFTISMWYERDANANHPLMSSLHSGTDDFRILSWSTILYGAIDDGVSWADASYTIGSSTDKRHIVFRFNGTHIVLFNDGTEGTSVAQTWTGGFSDTTIEFCTRFSGGYCDGVIDQIIIYNRSLSSSEVTQLYNSGNGYNPYAPSGNPSFIEITGAYLDPNTSVTIDTTVDATATFNTTCSSCYVHTKTFINGVLDDTDTGANNLSGSSYTFEAFTVGEFVGNDDLIASFRLVNGSNTSQVFIDWTNTSTLTVDNTAPNASQAQIYWNNPQTFENINATCLVEDRDGDSFDILIEIYKNTVLVSNTTATKTLVSGNVYKGTVAIANTSTSVGDSYQVKCRGYDGTDYGTQIAGSLYTIINELMTTTVSVNETSPISHNKGFTFLTSATYATANTSLGGSTVNSFESSFDGWNVQTSCYGTPALSSTWSSVGSKSLNLYSFSGLGGCTAAISKVIYDTSLKLDYRYISDGFANDGIRIYDDGVLIYENISSSTTTGTNITLSFASGSTILIKGYTATAWSSNLYIDNIRYSGFAYQTDVYKNGVLFKTTPEIYANETTIGDTFTFYSSVSAEGRRLSNIKSTTATIGNTAPTITSAYLLPTPPQDADNLLTYCQITDADEDLINLTYTIYRNGISLATGSYLNLDNGTYNVYNVTNTSTTTDDIFIVNCQATDGYATTNINSSVFTILPDDLNVELVSDNSEYSAPTYYARSLNYVTRYNNCTSSGVFYLYVDDTSVRSLSFNCDAGGEDYYFNGTYQHSNEGATVLVWKAVLSNGTSYNFSKTYTYDLFPPTATITPEQITNGFGGSSAVTVGLTCSDTAYTPLINVYKINGVIDYNTSYASGYIFNDSINLPDGNTNLSLSCYDLFSSDTETYTYTAYTKDFALIDEVTGLPFAISNLTYARLWFGDNSTYYDFVNTSTNQVSVTSTTITDLRFVYKLADGSYITRYIDMQYLPDGELLICVNKDNVAHFEQIYSASSNKPVIIKNQYAGCYIAADETKFAYQDSLILRAFTIDSTYYLYTYTDGAQVFLSSLDGAIQSAVSIDVLEFSNTAYNFNILQSAVTFSQTSGGDVKIFYQNIKGDNEEMSVSITRLDTNEEVFTTSDIDNANLFYLIFSTAILSGVDSTTLFKIVFTAELEDGTTKVITRYFNNNGSNGTLNPTFAAVFAIVLLFFGLSLAVTRVTFSWFGVVVLFFALAILGFTTAEYYIIVLQAITSIILVYTIIIMYKSNSETIS